LENKIVFFTLYKSSKAGALATEIVQ
jgi:hypothetical protein